MKAISAAADYHKFLYATVGDETNGMQLTLLSALARRNVDPWAEAEELSQLSGDRARTRLAAMLESSPGLAVLADRIALAGRLIPLLPHGSPRSAGSGEVLKDPSLAAPTAANLKQVQMVLIYIAMVLLGGWLASAASPPAASTATTAPTAAPAPTAGTSTSPPALQTVR